MSLPLHPLVVHAATVLLPLSLLGVVVAVLVPRLRPRLAGLSVLGLVAAAAAAWVAEETGESLADQVGVAQDHERYGEILPVLAVLALVVSGAWWRLQRSPVAGAPSWAPRAAGAGVVVVALVTTWFTVLAGHSGAVSVWESKTAAQESAAASAPATTTPGGGTATAPAAGSQSPAAAASGGSGPTSADVAKHNSRTDCWSVVDGTVYDLTSWIGAHPGGPGTITGMCGVDASAAFRGQHATKAGPAAALAKYAVGPLATGTAGSATAGPTAAAPVAAAPTTRYTRAQVASHSSTSNCWSIVEGKVYDLTQWVSRHPGGSEGIVEMCGGNGGEFLEEHSRDAAARKVLAGYQVGVLA
ncbi:cytochrome b5-like heme/steroid binding domain-containing protein [Kineosporia sp. A_224]|uniref:cytochrome b5-like heme/steroid binding domain-containing protein n=1 Tax=Kineosporia sp. A_224 TaxID=1962180 RepID=UPI0018E9C323|nr:cytochrome b5-like heme/steroid binding domain-containing protein [Kineosporia sp. A_224]